MARELVEANGSTRLRLRRAIRDLYQAAANARLNDDDIALVAWPHLSAAAATSDPQNTPRKQGT